MVDVPCILMKFKIILVCVAYIILFNLIFSLSLSLIVDETCDKCLLVSTVQK